MADPATSTADQAAQQAAQQAAEAVQQAARQAAADTTRAIIDASRTAASQEVGAEREMETGLDEYFKHQSQVNALNSKRSFDEYQHESLESIRRNRTLVDRMAGLSVDHDQQIRNIALQALQNATETANLVGKQAVRHSDIAIDQEWNPVQQGAADTLTARAVSIDDASLKAIGAVVAAAVANALSAASTKSNG